jgi:hypothetical protein
MTRLKTWRFITGSLLLLIVKSLPAQEPRPQESVIDTQVRDVGGFMELDLRFGDMMGEFAAFPGGRAAVLLKQRLYLGVGGAGLATDNAAIQGPVPGSTQPLRMGYGGMLVGYVIPTRSLVEVTADVLVGGGKVNPEHADVDDEIFVFEPSAALQLRLAPRVVRLALGASYRFVGDVDLAGIEDSDLRGFTGTVSVRLGWF